MLSKEEMRKYLILAKEGDEKAKETIVENNIGLVRGIVKRYIHLGYEYEDLCQIGMMGLVKAIRGFDITRDNAFSTYAVLMISGEIKRFLRDDGKIKVSRSIKELSLKAERARQAFLYKNKREPTISEISKIVGAEPEEVSAAIASFVSPISLDSPMGDDEKGETYEIVGEDISDETVEKIALKDAINKLDSKEKSIIYLRYFKGQTQTNVARILNMTQVQVSRNEKKIIKKLYNKLAE